MPKVASNVIFKRAQEGGVFLDTISGVFRKLNEAGVFVLEKALQGCALQETAKEAVRSEKEAKSVGF